ncbi:MAG TPA: hypothetical protein VNY05_45380 [Candidatus Acidoferrales bacterium]|nr:hypothetical protein [Candidatus Acidoferrales bacterium]
MDLRADKTYGIEDQQEEKVKRRHLPWLVAFAIVAVALIALAEGYLA